MLDFEKLTRKWFDSDNWWLCIFISACTASSTELSCKSAILWSFLLWENKIRDQNFEKFKLLLLLNLRKKFKSFNLKAILFECLLDFFFSDSRSTKSILKQKIINMQKDPVYSGNTNSNKHLILTSHATIWLKFSCNFWFLLIYGADL